MTQTNTKRIFKLDASAASTSSCGRRLYNTVVLGYRSPLNNNDMEFGSAFHLFIKVMKLTGGDYAQAIKAATERYSVPMNVKRQKQYMDTTFLLKCCMDYWQKFAEKDDFVTQCSPESGKALVELKFEWPFYQDDELEIILAGTIDDICKHKHGTWAIRDYKTTSAGDIDEYLRGYRMSPQLLFYRYVMGRYAWAYPDSIFAELCKRNCACFIEGIFIRGKDKPLEVKRSDMFQFTEADLNEFEILLTRKVERLVEMIKHEIPMREGLLNGACDAKFRCPYFDLCAANDDTVRDHLLRRNFIIKPYDPATF